MWSVVPGDGMACLYRVGRSRRNKLEGVSLGGQTRRQHSRQREQPV